MTSSNQNLKFRKINRDRLFYDRWQYNFGFALIEACCLREKFTSDTEFNRQSISKAYELRESWHAQHWQRAVNYGGSWRSSNYKAATNLHTLTNLRSFHDRLIKWPTEDYKMVITQNSAQIYTDSIDLINDLDSLPFLSAKTYQECNIDRPRGTIALINSNYQYRSYFRNVKVEINAKHNIEMFLKQQGEDLRLSPSLIHWFKEPKYTRIWDNFFVDYNHPSIISMLSLIQPNLVRKTLNIIKKSTK